MLTSIARITWNLSKDAKENNLNWFIEIGFVPKRTKNAKKLYIP